MINSVLLIALFTSLTSILFFLVFQKLNKDQQKVIQQNTNEYFQTALSSLRGEMDKFVQAANERFIQEQTKSTAILEQSKRSVEHEVEDLTKELNRITTLIQEFEKDRGQKFGALEERLTQTALETRTLSETTGQLSRLMGNNQLRGQWGERIAEDILRTSGLLEGVHYLVNQSQETLLTRPDYTFLLPNKHKVYMDVKFPLKNYMEYANAKVSSDKDRFLGDFIRDVKNRIRELKKRDYINIEEQTLDYIILFIPNEQIFGAIHQLAPGIMDEALSQKILLVSPYSLYAVLSTIRQAYDNFYFKNSTHKILKLISTFVNDYENFKKRYLELGESLDKTKEKYLLVSDKSFKKLDLRLKKLEEFRKGQQEEDSIEEIVPSEAFLVK